MMPRAFFPVALLVCVVLVMPARVAPSGVDTYTLQLGDFGHIEYDRQQPTPNTRRIVSLLVMLFDLHPHVDLPPTTIELMSTRDFEEFIAKREGGPTWRVWLGRYRLAYMRYMGWCDPVKARKGQLRIVTDEITDSVLVHETLHYINCNLTTDCLLLNNHGVIIPEVQVFMASPAYKRWKRERPWAGG